MRQFEQQLDLTGIIPEGSKKTPTASFTAFLLDEPEEMQIETGSGGRRFRPAVIICPGGGYEHLSVREGEPVAKKYLAMGCHVFVLHYSLAPDRFPVALLELAMLMGRIHMHAEAWGIDREKIIVSGFSAGGHLAACLGVFWNRDFLWSPLGLNPAVLRPSGLLLAYPVITSGTSCHEGSFEALLGEEKNDPEKRRLVSLELHTGPHVPKTFIWHTVTDQSVPVMNAMLFAESLMRHQVSTELHLFPQGCHGLALATEETAMDEAKYVEPCCQSWISLARVWLKSI